LAQSPHRHGAGDVGGELRGAHSEIPDPTAPTCPLPSCAGIAVVSLLVAITCSKPRPRRNDGTVPPSRDRRDEPHLPRPLVPRPPAATAARAPGFGSRRRVAVPTGRDRLLRTKPPPVSQARAQVPCRAPGKHA
jgi:hypothetical protein